MPTLSAVFTLLLFTLAGYPDPMPLQSAEAALSSDARSALRDQWPGWQLAQVDGDAAACEPGASAGPVQLDIDGDQLMDLAVAIQTGSGVRLVVLRRRLDGYHAMDVEGLGDGMATGYLSVTPRATRFVDPQSNVPDYLVHDTLTVLQCGSPVQRLYVWHGFRFERVEVR